PRAPPPILGRTCDVRDPSGDEDARRVAVLARERNTDIGPTIQGDPTLNGATLRLIASRATFSTQTYALDAAGWSASVPGRVFRYRGPTGADGDPVRMCVLYAISKRRATVRA